MEVGFIDDDLARLGPCVRVHRVLPLAVYAIPRTTLLTNLSCKHQPIQRIASLAYLYTRNVMLDSSYSNASNVSL